MNSKSIEERCTFKTARLSVCGLTELLKDRQVKDTLTKNTIEILSPQVTKSLPDGWQNVKSVTDAKNWLTDRINESHVIAVHFLSTNALVGFIFFYESGLQKNYYDLRFGYLLSEVYWGQGLGTELIQGLLDWCKKAGDIRSISGGVERENTGSIRVLEKTGFTPSTTDQPGDGTLFYEYRFNTD